MKYYLKLYEWEFDTQAYLVRFFLVLIHTSVHRMHRQRETTAVYSPAFLLKALLKSW